MVPRGVFPLLGVSALPVGGHVRERACGRRRGPAPGRCLSGTGRPWAAVPARQSATACVCAGRTSGRLMAYI